MLTFLNNTTPS